MTEQSDKSLQHYEVLLCATGGIACYKAAELTSALVRAGCGVTVAMTQSATRFVAPLTFQTLTGRRVYTSLWEASDNYESQHLSLTEAADLMILAPATANILAKMACGIADELVSTLAVSAHGACKVLVAPAMNTRMWQAPATAANVEKLKGWGIHFIGPESGRLACGTAGIGRMAEPEDILEAARRLLLAEPPKRSA